jgi:hypothetical protein
MLSLRRAGLPGLSVGLLGVIVDDEPPAVGADDLRDEPDTLRFGSPSIRVARPRAVCRRPPVCQARVPPR